MQLNEKVAKAVSDTSNAAKAAQAVARAAATAAVPEPDESLKVYFDGDSVEVRSADLAAIEERARTFLAGPGGTLIVSGHANPLEEPQEAVSLSMNRTESVAALLERFGVQSHRIVRVSHGANAPFADAEDQRANWANRCVEIRHGGLVPRQPVWSQRTRKGARKG